MSRSSAHCSAINCRNRQSKRPDLSFFRFPKQKDRCRQWAQNAGRADLVNRTALYVHNNCRLCAEHFTDDQFSNRQVKTRLKWNAFPSLFQVRNPPKAQSISRRPVKRMHAARADDSSSHSATAKRRKEVYSALSEHAYSVPPEDSPRSDSPGTHSIGTTPIRTEQPRTFSLKRQVESLKKPMEKAANEAKSIAELIKSAKQFLDEPASLFFASQLRNSARRRHRAWGGRWSYDDEVTALSLYRLCPRAYMFCRRVFTLPSVPSPRRWLRHTEMRPGFPQRIFDLLKNKVACMREMGKLCVVAFGKMKLRSELWYNVTEDLVEGFEDFGSQGRTGKRASYALVFMVRGLVTKWKQPVGYFLTKNLTPTEKLVSLLRECLSKLSEIGLVPKAVVCDQGSRNVRLYENLGVTEERPFFYREDHKIFCLHDPRHLLNNTCSNLEKHAFCIETGFERKLVKWSYIQRFYDFDSQLPIRTAPKLSKRHFNLTSFSKTRGEKVAHVLSHTVAAGICTYSALGKLPKEALHTAEFIETVDILFDALSSRFYKGTKKMKRPISSKSGHLEFLKSCVPTLKTLKVEGSGDVSFIQGWLLAISCVTQLWEHLQVEGSVKYLFTSRLNLEIVENLFSVLRRTGGRGGNPTPEEFRRALRKEIVAELLKPTGGASRSTDADQFALALQSLTSRKRVRRTQATSRLTPIRNVCAVSVQLNLPKENAMQYMAGYLCRRVLGGHELLSSCHACRSALLAGDPSLNVPGRLLVRNKERDTSSSDSGAVKVPSDEFVAFISQCEDVFRRQFHDANMGGENVCQVLQRYMCELNLYSALSTCNERVKSRIVAVFVNVRLQYALKLKNKLYKMAGKRKSRKLQKASHE